MRFSNGWDCDRKTKCMGWAAEGFRGLCRLADAGYLRTGGGKEKKNSGKGIEEAGQRLSEEYGGFGRAFIKPGQKDRENSV